MTGQQLDAAYMRQRQQLAAATAAAAARTWLQFRADRNQAITQTVAVVENGQALTVRLLNAYLAARTLQETSSASLLTVDPGLYTISRLRRVSAETVYGRPYGALYSQLHAGLGEEQALASAQASVEKLAATDMQLAQTHAARDWMRQNHDENPKGLRVVGYRRVLTGAHSCQLCTLASTRTYRVSELMPIHEHCDCTIAPVYGYEPVASVETTVRVEDDPEIGPRLMADTWSNVGPRLTA